MSSGAKNSTMAEKANAAFRQAMADVIVRARQTKTTVIVWEDGRVVEYSVDEMQEKIIPMDLGR